MFRGQFATSKLGKCKTAHSRSQASLHTNSALGSICLWTLYKETSVAVFPANPITEVFFMNLVNICLKLI